MPARALPSSIPLDPGMNAVLRVIQLEDVPEFFKLIQAHRTYFAQYDTYINTDLGTLQQVAIEIEAVLERLAAGTSLTHGIWVQGRLVGRFGVRLEPDTRRAQFSYVLAPLWQGFGLVTRAGETLMRHLFTELGYREIRALCEPDNVPSIAVARRLGLTYDGQPLVELESPPGDVRRLIRYAITAEQWRQRHP
ncbi:MAG TPA: GNAT family protein [Candidatus Saccharimonadia bacterium]|nr:GNAT family protein [Candidatus Saccharimonadia bacterium]